MRSHTLYLLMAAHTLSTGGLFLFESACVALGLMDPLIHSIKLYATHSITYI
jgi:hypothetical protein